VRNLKVYSCGVKAVKLNKFNGLNMYLGSGRKMHIKCCCGKAPRGTEKALWGCY
jgi:hypothetical protein